jgi:hypothetical protein
MKEIKLKKPLIPDGWTIEEDSGQKSFVPEFALSLEPEQKTGSIEGETLRERLKGKEVMNAAVLDYLLTHTELIPEAWKSKYVCFWGTVYRYSGGHLYVRCLYWCDGVWDWNSYWLDYRWDDRHPTAVRASTVSSESNPSSDFLNLELRIAKLEEIIKHHNLGV